MEVYKDAPSTNIKNSEEESCSLSEVVQEAACDVKNLEER